MKITVVGAGYVGLALATLLSQKNEVVIIDVIKEKVDMINNRISPIKDDYITNFFNKKKLNLKATLNDKEAFINSNYIIICVPTNYDDKLNCFDTSQVDETIKKIKNVNPNSTIVIKSTVPIGYTKKAKQKFNLKNIIFSPEFSREGNSLYDNLYPSRIIIGNKGEEGKKFAKILKDLVLKNNVVVKFTNSDEAEAIKLFSNTFLALRISFFNELDTFSEISGLNTEDIIEGVCLDERIGDYYNNPSFGYGGYCLPKDTKQLLNNYKNIPQSLIKAIIESNKMRKEHIVDMIISKEIKVVGIYRLAMKNNSDNYRNSAIIDIITKLKSKNIDIVIYEPTINESSFMECKVINDFDKFNNLTDIVLANRLDDRVKKIDYKIYTRDLYNIN